MKTQITFHSTILLLFFFLLQADEFNCSSLLEHRLCHHDEALALLQFKEMFKTSTEAPFECNFPGQYPYPKMKYWKANTDCCSWDGVTCHNITGHIIGLDLSCSQLEGIIKPNTSLFHLSHLESLNLAYNDLCGTRISRDFGSLRSLTYLNLSNSNFQGEIASELSQLSYLISLDLSVNFPTTSLCSSFGSHLTYEPGSFEMLLRNLTRLRVLSLNSVNVSSEVTMMNLSSSLTDLDLSSTGLHGILPSNVFHLPNLQALLLNWNHDLIGSVPNFNCSISSSLKWLGIRMTKFSGVLPDSIGCLKSLISLDLAYCQIFGAIPESFGNLTQLVELDMRSNSFNDNFPISLPNLPYLEFLDLSNNLLTGQVGDFKSRSLESINLKFNHLSGSIRRSIFTLMNLYSLDLSFNKFKGIEQNMLRDNKPQNTTRTVDVSLPYLEQLGLSSCEIKEFPEFLRDPESLTMLDLSNNKINGQIPSWFYVHEFISFVLLESFS